MAFANLMSMEQEFDVVSEAEVDEQYEGQTRCERTEPRCEQRASLEGRPHRPEHHAAGSCTEQEPVCCDTVKDSGCPALPSSFVSCQTPERQRHLGELTATVQKEAHRVTQLDVEPPTSAHCSDESISNYGASEDDHNESSPAARQVELGLADGGLTQEQEVRDQGQDVQNMMEKCRCQETEQQEGDQESQKIMKSIENQKVQSPAQQNETGRVPTVTITNLEEVQESAESQAEDVVVSQQPEDTVSCDANRSASPSEAQDFSSSDLQSLMSDSVSLLSEPAISGKESSEEDTRSIATSSIMEGPEEDTRSVTASSVLSLFPRMQMDPVEREWLRCAALGNVHALRQLLLQDPNLASKKDFVTTALHWAAKQGHIETVDMMARSGADINHKAGYTPLHLASLHGHTHIIHLLVNTYNAKVNIRDYHGKMAAHYWNGNTDIFIKAGSQTGGRWSRGRRGQRYAHLSALLSRSRSQGSLYTDQGPGSVELTTHYLAHSERTNQALLDTF